MNRDLLDALGALAAEVYFDALQRHPGLFTITGKPPTPADLPLLPVLAAIDELIWALGALSNPPRPESDDDLPF